jgi:signal transduction histidine kinase
VQPLKRLRLQLTAWYAGTFSLILLVLGAALVVVLSGQLSGDLDLRLESSVSGVRRAMEVRRAYGAAPDDALRGAVAEVTSPDRLLYLFGGDGQPILAPSPIDPRIVEAAGRVLRDGEDVSDEFRTSRSQRWRLYADRITPSDTEAFALVAVADATGFRKQFERLLATFLAATLLALIVVGIGGYRLAGVSTAPVERAMKQLRDLTANAAHELRTPVSVIRGYAELALERERDSTAYAAALRQVAAESSKLSRLVDNLFTLARAEAGTWPWRRERLFLDDLADEAVESAAVLGAQRGVRVTLGRFEEVPIEGDRDLLRQLLMILLDNAVKFTPRGGMVRLDVFVDHSHPTLVVEDTGIGIAPQHLPHVFERFFRADPGRAREGAGLGLAIARWILDQHGAEINLHSVPDQGTRVTLRFPAPTPGPAAPVANQDPVISA